MGTGWLKLCRDDDSSGAGTVPLDGAHSQSERLGAPRPQSRVTDRRPVPLPPETLDAFRRWEARRRQMTGADDPCVT